MTEARTLLYRATEIDPSYPPAFSLLAQVDNFFFTSRVGNEYAHLDTTERVLKAASQATKLSLGGDMSGMVLSIFKS
jgi:hypothetical protein